MPAPAPAPAAAAALVGMAVSASIPPPSAEAPGPARLTPPKLPQEVGRLYREEAVAGGAPWPMHRLSALARLALWAAHRALASAPMGSEGGGGVCAGGGMKKNTFALASAPGGKSVCWHSHLGKKCVLAFTPGGKVCAGADFVALQETRSVALVASLLKT